MGAYNYAPRTNLNVGMLYRQSVAVNGAFRRPPQNVIAKDLRAIAIAVPHEVRLTDINILPAGIIFTLKESPRITISSAISGLDERVANFVKAMETRVSEGKMPENRLNELIAKISQLRSEAEQSLLQGNFDAFVETADSIGQIMTKADFLSEMYSEKLNIQVIRDTIDEAYSSGTLSSDDHAILRKMLSDKVRENAGALMAGDESRFMASLIELASMMELAEIIGRGLGEYREQAADQNISAMNKTARERILPGMRSANIINQELLEKNQLIIEFASRFLLELRRAQAEILSGTRAQLEAINKARTISENQIPDIMDAIRIVADTTEQAGISDINEDAISDDNWRNMWNNTTDGELREYFKAKAAIANDSQRIAELFAEIEPKMFSAPSIATEWQIPKKWEGAKINEMPDSPHGQVLENKALVWLRKSIWRYLLSLIIEQSDAREKAAQERADKLEEKARTDKRKLLSKLQREKDEARHAEYLRVRNETLKKLDSIKNKIVQAKCRASAMFALFMREKENSMLADVKQANRMVLYYEHLAAQENRKTQARAA